MQIFERVKALFKKNWERIYVSPTLFSQGFGALLVIAGLALLVYLGEGNPFHDTPPTDTSLQGKGAIVTSDADHVKPVEKCILLKADTQTIRPGRAVTFTAYPPNASRMTDVTLNSLNNGSHRMMQSSKGSYVCTVIFPKQFVGKDAFVVTGMLFDELAMSDKLEVLAIPNMKKLSSIKNAAGPTCILSPGDKTFFYITGKFTDGKIYDLSSGAVGTTYETTDPDVISVDSEGNALAIKTGRAKVSVKNGRSRYSIDVIVQEPKAPANASNS